MPTMTLQLHSDASGLRHYLDGKPVSAGDTIEVLFHGQWTKVQYEWIGKASQPPIGIVSEDATTISLKPETQVRWPQD
jgi:hypothetical protein